MPLEWVVMRWAAQNHVVSVDGGENPRIDGAVVSLAAFFPPRR